MWSVWLVFCDCGFHSVYPLMNWDKRLMEASWWERLTEGGNWVLFWWAGPCSVNLLSNFLLMGRAVFSPCCLTWGQTMVQVMKIMGTSVPPTMQQATVDPHLHQRLLDTHGQVVGSLLLSPGSWCTQGSVCALWVCFTLSCVSSDSSMVGVWRG